MPNQRFHHLAPVLLLLLTLTLSTTLLPAPALAQCPGGTPRAPFTPASSLCDGDAGGSLITVKPFSIRYNASAPGDRHLVLKPPVSFVPVLIKVAVRRPLGRSVVVVRKEVGAPVVRYRRDGKGRLFGVWVNVLREVVRGHQKGWCPVDSKGQVAPELDGVYERLGALLFAWGVKDCGVRAVPDISP